MIRATKVSTAGHWPERETRDRIVLDYDDRFRRRKRFVAEGGLEFLLDLGEAVPLRDGDGLALEGGGFVRVVAAEEKLIEVKAADAGALARLAWHLGNRHLPVAIQHERLLIRDDHVIVDMLKGLGAQIRAVSEPFDPEGGAYGQHNHDHRHPHGGVHDHAQHHDDHAHDHAHDHHHHVSNHDAPARSAATGARGWRRFFRLDAGLGLLTAAGVAPCAGAVIMVLIASVFGVLWAGLLGVLAIAVGMAGTLAAVGIASMLAHRMLIGDRASETIGRLTTIGAALIVVGTGGFLLLGAVYRLLSV
ncbi:MAG: hypothetical protein KIT36_24775 [Alphaproteobacteria bacterium]|nr:hypothetical protein [Alphaproteobacteria bacterium]